MKLARSLFWSSRPISWVNTAYPFAVAYLFSGGGFDLAFWYGAFYFLIPFNLLMYGVNDVYDFESDLRNPRKGGVEGALLEPALHRPTLLWSFGLGIPGALILASFGGLSTWFWLGLVMFTVVAYSLKGLRFKEIPFLDSLTSATHFVGPMLVGISLSGADPFDGNTLTITAAFTLWGAASHAFGAVQDVRADREAGIASIATSIGARRTTRIAWLSYLAAGLLVLLLPHPGPFAALAVVPYLLILAPHWNITDETCETANRGWRRFLWLNFFAGAVVSLLLINVLQARG